MNFVVDKLGSTNNNSWSSRVLTVKSVAAPAPLTPKRKDDAAHDAPVAQQLYLFVSKKDHPNVTHHHGIMPTKVELYPDFDKNKLYVYAMYSESDYKSMVCIKGYEVTEEEVRQLSLKQKRPAGSPAPPPAPLRQEQREETYWMLRFGSKNEQQVALNFILSRLPTASG